MTNNQKHAAWVRAWLYTNYPDVVWPSETFPYGRCDCDWCRR